MKGRGWLWIRKFRIALGLSALTLIIYYFSLPEEIFQTPYSTVLEDRQGNLLSASIAADGQWRFPQNTFVPEKFKAAITMFEDKRFDSHIGFDLLSIGRAFKQNIEAGEIVSGGSTLTMQVIRLSRRNRSRTVFEKILEIILATRLELRYSKSEILALYASHAPFGGNVVGIEAASWRYFGRTIDQMSWGEAALLAVLPNNPSLIHLGKNRSALKAKRDRLLTRLHRANQIDALTMELAMQEMLPKDPLPLPRLAKHLLDRAVREGMSQTRIASTVELQLQRSAEDVINKQFNVLRANQVYNAAALILEVNTGEVLAYVGNTNSGAEHSDKVDVIAAPRSTGSILKPFLYAAMMDEGKLLPQTLVPDVPTIISGFSPKNFSLEYDGAVAADQALIRSLNIPAVHELRDYRYEKFYDLLQDVGISTLTNPADHYGLSLVLGGAEGTLWDITGAYASMARVLNAYFEIPGRNRYREDTYHPPTFVKKQEDTSHQRSEHGRIGASAIWLTFEALQELYRPGEETGWQFFNSSKKIAWKTGTSFGFRDGWAVGVNPDYAVGVWVGNADGEGRPGLTGSAAAAPILFDLFNLLPGQTWFQRPTSEMTEIDVCRRSGQRASKLCDQVQSIWATEKGLQTTSCQYHKKVYLSSDKKFQLNSSCALVSEMEEENWFVLPPVQAYYYKSKNLSYRSLPPFDKNCNAASISGSMDLIYPKPGASIFVPKELDGNFGKVLFQVAHADPNATVYWHLDDSYVGTTQSSHQMPLNPSYGTHSLTLVDENGVVLRQNFTILSNP
ncbi:MAG: penicillin-binding protein 1C [Cyclobacteriaceae bacterium]